MAHRAEPAAPVDQQAVSVDPQHATLDLVSTADRQAVSGADVAHSPRVRPCPQPRVLDQLEDGVGMAEAGGDVSGVYERPLRGQVPQLRKRRAVGQERVRIVSRAADHFSLDSSLSAYPYGIAAAFFRRTPLSGGDLALNITAAHRGRTVVVLAGPPVSQGLRTFLLLCATRACRRREGQEIHDRGPIRQTRC